MANSIALFKNYVEDNNNSYAVFRRESLTYDLETPFIEFVGASTMSYPVMPFETADLPDYSKETGYSSVDAVLNRKEKTISQDKGYQIKIEATDLIDSHTTAVAFFNNKIRQLDVPSIDKYRLGALTKATGVTKATAAALTKTTVMDAIDAAVSSFVDNEVPVEGSILYVTTGTYNAIKQSTAEKRIVQNGDNNVDRQVEYLDSMIKIIVVPATRMPAKTNFILVQPKALICGIKYSVSKFIEDPEDFDGVKVNRHIQHDCFVQEDRAKGVYVHPATA